MYALEFVKQFNAYCIWSGKEYPSKPTDNVVIVGVGRSGLMAIQLAKAATGAKIIATCLFVVFHVNS
jgi:threonine dehydrogenase-like Zn-dependent dehydrogenase